MNPRTDPDVVCYKGNYVLVNPQGALAKVNKYTVMYIVEVGPDVPDRPIMLFYRKNRKTVCTTTLASPRCVVGNDMIDFIELVNTAMRKMRKQKPLS